MTTAPSAAARAFLDGPHRLLIGGEWVDGQGRTIAVENPAREDALTEVRAASLDQLDQAVSAARSALHGDWSRLGGRDRGVILSRFADLLEARADLIGEVMTLDNGSPLASSKMVVRHLAAELFRYYAGWASKIAGDSFQPSLTARPTLDIMVATVREPIGVVGAIVPWNAPPGMIALKMAPALAAGCTVVLKTAELAPLVGDLFAQIWIDAGGPAGAFNLVHGHGEDIGAAMAAHPLIDKIAFTGSTAVGRKIVDAATGNLKKVSLELGGKSPVIVFPDADLDAVIPAAAMACYLSTGQQCMAGSRLFLHADIHDRVAEGVAAFAKTLTVGDGLDPDTVLGPMISARQKARVLDYIAIARAEGATPLLESDVIDGPGHFIGPALLTDVTPGMRIEQEEVFGPVLSVIRFDDEDAVIEAVNGTPYGLSGSVWTRDIARALRVAKRVDSGQVGVNIHAAMSAETPFGGNRQSGWGREFGRDGLDGYLKTKAISINLGPKP
ncbi:aldehyde dehydrogenase family protein [Sphingomonas sp. SUN019]|uniref:aldehyde dehydrogenase family protein n=1 Tax=Sphingomonas sp. SUN019 TaxID=2937788 RepID=UPI002164636F|nr:aldehyde dehydrogenase family protein [Sphingomonas sp. SUN019]UVO50715.1 aldehyde dehydrogenase family protein [Sphingomonas sp. SUN019]